LLLRGAIRVGQNRIMKRTEELAMEMKIDDITESGMREKLVGLSDRSDNV